MTVDELVAKLQEYPGYWPVDLLTEMNVVVLEDGTDVELDERRAPVRVVESHQSWVHQTPAVVLS
jgi:hypothetical protein